MYKSQVLLRSSQVGVRAQRLLFKQPRKSLFCTPSLRIPESCFQLLNAEENMKEGHEARLLHGNEKSSGNARLLHHLNLLSFKTEVGRCL